MDPLQDIIKIYESRISLQEKVDLMYDKAHLALNPDRVIPSNQELLKLFDKHKDKSPAISKLEITKDGNFTFLVYQSVGYSDWWDRETLSPFLFYMKCIKPFEEKS
jgi:hypothetical protein